MPTLRIDMHTGNEVIRIYKSKISYIFNSDNIIMHCLNEVRSHITEKIIKRMFYDYENDP